MSADSRIYLDNAATSFPKPNVVYEAVDNYQRTIGAAVGRSAYREAINTQAVVDRCRKRAADLLGAENSERIIFTFNGTDSLNLALHGLLRPGDHVVTSIIEHNSVLRPLRFLSEHLGIEVSYVSADQQGRIDASAVQAELRPNTRLVAIIHASNVTGTIQPIAEIGEVARRADAKFLVDAAQSAGHLPIDLSVLPVDLLACPGHKGLLGPLGTGLLYVRPGLEEELASVRQGGTGSQSEEDRQPDRLPDKYESGNHNAPGLIGLEASLDWLQSEGVSTIRAHEMELTVRLTGGLNKLRDVSIHGPDDPNARVGVVSLSVEGFEPQILASVLDDSFGVQTRGGLHCAPGAHRTLDTLKRGGTTRISVGPFTTTDEIDAAVHAIGQLKSN